MTGTGPGGQVTKEDVEKFIARKQPRREEGIPELEEILPLVGIRKAIADGMSLSVRTAAHVTTVAEVDMTELVKLRSDLAPQWKDERISLTYVPGGRRRGAAPFGAAATPPRSPRGRLRPSGTGREP